MTIYGGDPVRFDPGKSPTVKFSLTDEAKAAGLPFPERKHDSDAGFDLRAFAYRGPDPQMLFPLDARTVAHFGTGVRASIPPGWCGIVKMERSSYAATMSISGGLIDSGYIGEIVIVCTMQNYALQRLVNSIHEFPRFAQLVIVPVWTGGVEYVDRLDETERGAGGFGSTGQG